MTITLERPVTVADLAPEDVRDRLAAYIVREHPEFTHKFAVRLVLEAAAFQAASAAHPGIVMAPSKLVDHGWHAWIMHTRDRDVLMQRIGADVPHVPDLPGEEPGDRTAIRHATLNAIEAAGFAIDQELWASPSAECTQCHAGCSDSPNSGKGKK